MGDERELRRVRPGSQQQRSTSLPTDSSPSKAYDLLPIGTAYCTGKSEEDAINKFVAERDDVSREQIVGVIPQSRKLGMFTIHYSRPGVTQFDLLGFAELRNNCIECGEYIEIDVQGPHRKFCDYNCKMRYHRRKKRERDDEV